MLDENFNSKKISFELFGSLGYSRLRLIGVLWLKKGPLLRVLWIKLEIVSSFETNKTLFVRNRPLVFQKKLFFSLFTGDSQVMLPLFEIHQFSRSVWVKNSQNLKLYHILSPLFGRSFFNCDFDRLGLFWA